MNRSILPAILIACLIRLVSIPVMAGGVADFGTASKSTITLNPAGAAIVDRILFDFTLFGYKGENRYSPYGDKVRFLNSQAYLQVARPSSSPNAFQYDTLTAVSFEEGNVSGLHLDFAYPTKTFTVGASFDSRHESYKKGSYITYLGTEYSTSVDGTPLTGVEADLRRNTTSILFAVPLKLFSFGIRQNQREVKHTFEELDSIYILDYIGGYSFLTPYYFTDAKIAGRSFYKYYDYGVLMHISEDQPMFDLGFLYRPPVDAVFEFESLEIPNASSPSNYSLADFDFTEPGINLANASLAVSSGRTLWNFVVEAGKYTKTDDSLQAVIRPGTSQRNRAYDIMGYLVRFAYHPVFDIAYGVRSNEIAGSLTEITTKGIKFPFPFYKDLIISIGSKEIVIKDDDDEIVVKSTSYTFSTEIKFGKPVTRPGRGLTPKTKKLPPDFP